MRRKGEAIAVLQAGLQRAPSYPELNKNLCFYLANVNLLEETKVACAVVGLSSAPDANGASPLASQGAP